MRIGRAESPPPGRDGDLRAVLALLDEHRAVAVAAGRGMGRTALLETIADLYGVPCFRGRPPERIARGDLVVLDDAQRLGRRALAALLRRVVEKEGRALLALSSITLAPRRVRTYRLESLDEAASRAILEGRRALADGLAREVSRRCAGHPALLRRASRWLSRTRRGHDLGVLERVLAEEVQSGYLDDLGRAARREAALLAGAGGWLPDGLGLRGFATGVADLVAAGLAERIDGAVVASPLLLVARWPEPKAQRWRAVLAELRRRRALDRALVRLAEAHLLLGLGEEARALEAIREAHRASRGKAPRPFFLRGVDRLALRARGEVGACAELASIVLALPRHRDVALARAQARALLRAGLLAREEQREATTFLAYLHLEEDRLAEAACALEESAEGARAEGDVYGEAYALLWAVWARTSEDDLAAAEPLVERVSRLARASGAPALEVRALHVRARIDALEGDVDAAIRHLRPALKVARRHGLDDDQLVVLGTLAELAGRQGRPSEAAEWLEAADAILARAHPSRRRGNLAITRAEVALRRGHVREARRILASAAAELGSEPWKRDMLEVEALLAAAEYGAAARRLARAAPHPGQTREWLRRRAAATGVLLREGFSPKVDLEALGGDPLARLVLHRSQGALDEAGRLLDDLEARSPREDPASLPLLYTEAIAVRLMQGRLREAAKNVSLLRDRFAAEAGSTAVMLLLEGVVEVVFGQPLEAARRALRAHRAAMALGQRRMALFALELLAVAHVALGRERGLDMVLERGERLARDSGSRTRRARQAALRVVRALRFGATPPAGDLERVRSGPDALARALVDRLSGEAVARPLEPVAEALARLLAADPGEGAPWAPPREGRAELEIRIGAREVKLAGGRTVSFVRRRVLWRVLLELVAAAGRPVAPDELYTAAWELPFNQSRLNSLYVGIRRLRLLVEPDPSAPRILLVGPSGGYYLDLTRVRVRDDDA